MPENSTRFFALKRLSSEFKGAQSLLLLQRLTQSFVEEHLHSEAVELLRTAAVPDVPTSTDDISVVTPLYLPIPQTDYWLKLQRSLPFNEEEAALAELVAALLASTPVFTTAPERTTLQKQLLSRLNKVVANQEPLDAVTSVLTQDFTDAFPGATGRLVLLNQDGDRVWLRVRWGEASDDELTPEMRQILNTGNTAELTHHRPPHIIIPIKVGGVVEGMLEVVYAETAVLTTSDIDSLELLAGYLGICLSNRRMRDQAEQRAHQLERVFKVMEPTWVLRPLETALGDVQQQLLSVFNVDTSYIVLYDAPSQLLTFPHMVVHGQRVAQQPVSGLDGDSLVAWVVANNQPYITADWQIDDKPVPGLISDYEARSVICVPMRVGDEVVGAISIQSDVPDAFTSADFQVLMHAAGYVAVIVKNARLHQSARTLVDKGARDYQTAVALRQAIAVVGTSLDQSVVLKNLLLALGHVFVYDTAFVFLWQDGVFRLAASRDYRDNPISVTPDQAEAIWRDNPLLQEMLRTKEPAFLTNTRDDPRWSTFEGGEQIRSWLGTPLVVGGQVVGVLMVDSKKEAAFGRHEEWLASTLAAHAAVAVQNARLHQKTQQQLAELGTLYQASAMMTANLDQDFVLQTVVAEMVRAVQVDSCTIFVWDETHQSLSPAAHENQFYSAHQPVDNESGEMAGLRTIEHLEQYPIVRRVFDTQEIHSLRYDNIHSPHQRALLEAAGLKSVLLVPLVRRNKVLGLLALGQISQPRTFTHSEIRLTQNLAGQAAVAIEHAHLFTQAQRRIEELSTFHEIVLQLNTPLQLSTVLDTITESALKLIEANNLHIFLYDAETQSFTYGSALWRDGRRTAAVAAPRSEGITMAVVRQGSPIVINQADLHPFFQSEEASSWGICAIAGFPLKQDAQVIGAFTATYLYPHTFSEDELLLLNLLADQAAVAVKNARLFAESQRRLRDMSALVDMAKQVTGNLKLKSVLQTTVQILQGLLSARASTITMLSEDGTELVVEAAAGVNPEYVKARMKLGEGVSGEVARRGDLIYIRDTYSEPDFLFFDEVVRSLLAVPLIIRDRAIGTLTVDSDRPNAFGKSDIQLMTIAAAQVSIAISNARLFEEVEERAAELAAAYEELKENDRLKDELVQNVSHELRTPLTFVKGYVDLLMDGEMGLMNPEQQDALQIVADKTDEITRLIDDIMTLQRIDASNLQLENVSMTELVKTAVAGHALVADKKGLRVLYSLPASESRVLIDKGRINQVLNNLIGNAMKFSPNGGKITVTLEDREDEVFVVVSDEGIGVPQDKMERIFDRFYQVDGSSRRRFSGTGLGLAIVKRIVDAHQGKIWVESKLNEGSSFYFSLPKTQVKVDSARIIHQ